MIPYFWLTAFFMTIPVFSTGVYVLFHGDDPLDTSVTLLLVFLIVSLFLSAINAGLTSFLHKQSRLWMMVYITVLSLLLAAQLATVWLLSRRKDSAVWSLRARFLIPLCILSMLCLIVSFFVPTGGDSSKLSPQQEDIDLLSLYDPQKQSVEGQSPLFGEPPKGFGRRRTLAVSRISK